jgi:hypothetical protein
MLEICRQIHISLNIKKCIFTTPIGILLGHIIYKDDIKVNMAKINVIINLKPPFNQNKINIFLGHIGYYKKFIKNHSNITFPIDEILRNDVEFIWSTECNTHFELLKRKLVEEPISIFHD